MIKTIFKPFIFIFTLYKEGIPRMTVGKSLWTLVIIKLIIVFGVFRFIIFDDRLTSRFDTQEEISEFILKDLTDRI